jgi:hypothetical protein
VLHFKIERGTLTYGGADIMTPSNYTAIITEGEKIDVDQFLVAE